MTMTLVSTVTVGAGGAASIDFTSIPQTGTDLLVVLSVRGGGTTNIARLNNDSGGNYNCRYLEGTGSAASSGLETASTYIFSGSTPSSSSTANTFGNTSFYLPNYTSSNTKSISIDAVMENNATASKQHIIAANWTGTSAVTSLTFLATFAQYSTASLYTITKGSGGATVA